MPGPSFVPVQRVRTYESIVRQIRGQIVEGVLREGDRLPTERALALQFQVSRPTVREAIRVLASMGLVEPRAGSGVYVRQQEDSAIYRSLSLMVEVGQTSLSQVLEVRSVLEAKAAELAAASATREQVTQMAHAVEEMQSETSVDKELDADWKFHSALADASGNPFLATVCRFMTKLLIDAQRVAFAGIDAAIWRERMEAYQTYHRRLLEAIRDRDSEAAVQAIRDHHGLLSAEVWPVNRDLKNLPVTGLLGRLDF